MSGLDVDTTKKQINKLQTHTHGNFILQPVPFLLQTEQKEHIDRGTNRVSVVVTHKVFTFSFVYLLFVSGETSETNCLDTG